MEKQVDNILNHINDNIKEPQKLLKFLDIQDHTKIKEKAWQITDNIMDFLKNNPIFENDFNLYKEIIVKVAQVAIPKEMYIGLLEHFDPHVEVRLVRMLLKPLQIVLKRLVDEDIRACILSLDMGYTSITYYIQGMNVPDYSDFDPLKKCEEKHEAINIINVLKEVLEALKHPLKVIADNHKRNQLLSSKEIYGSFVNETFKFLCDILNILLMLDISEETSKINPKSSKSDAGNDELSKIKNEVCNDVMIYISLIYSPQILVLCEYWGGNFLKVQTDENGIENETQTNVAENSRACYLYLLYSRHLCHEKHPKVWSYEFLLCLCMKDIIRLLSNKSPVIVDKGLALCRAVVNQLDKNTLSYEKISTLSPPKAIDEEERIQTEENESKTKEEINNTVMKIYESMITVAIYVPSKTLRSRAVDFLVKFTDKFQMNDQYIIVKYSFTKVKHSGVLGVLIHYVKEKINAELKGECKGSTFTKPSRLKPLLEEITHLPGGTETDLLVYSDKIMPALNLIIFLLLLDKENKTGILNLKDSIKEKFLSPLRTGLNLSRAHYQSELKRCQKKKKEKVPEMESDDKNKFTVNGLPLPNLPLDQQKQTLNTALSTFDMMEITLSRVEELYI